MLFQVYVLMAVCQARNGASAAEILRWIEAREGGRFGKSLAQTVVALNRLIAQKMIVAVSVAPSRQIRGGRSRRLYGITKEGRRDLKEWIAFLARTASLGGEILISP